MTILIPQQAHEVQMYKKKKSIMSEYRGIRHKLYWLDHMCVLEDQEVCFNSKKYNNYIKNITFNFSF